MSCVGLLDNENTLMKNDFLISDMNMNLFSNDYLPLKEEEKNDEKSLSEESNFLIKRELYFRDLTNKNFFPDENEDDDLEDSRRYELNDLNFRKAFSNNVPFNNYISKLEMFNPINQINPINNNSQLQPSNINTSYNINDKDKKKIFNIVKVPKSKQQIFQCMQKKRMGEYRLAGKKLMCDWDSIPVPKEKHLHFQKYNFLWGWNYQY